MSSKLSLKVLSSKFGMLVSFSFVKNTGEIFIEGICSFLVTGCEVPIWQEELSH